ncbi:ester cyclase [Halorussus sp. AFM4]|uniref:ester cyclase n=1 Tax=Halorussus sp. AFM4 TaxID=3421651 RepID=UPI003EB9585C
MTDGDETADEEGGAQTVEERNKENLARLLEETHRENFDVVDELATEDVTTHGFFGMDATDRESYRRFYEDFAAAFGDQEFEVEDLIAEGDKVVVHFTITATHRGEVLGIEPTNERLSWSGVAIDRFEDGRVAEAWLSPDYLAILSQLGLLPDEVEA